MIIREFGIRPAQKVLAAPLRQVYLRALSTHQTPTAVSDPAESTIQSPNGQSQPPSIFTNSQVPSHRKKPDPPDTTAHDYHMAAALKQKIGKIGSKVKKTYTPGGVFVNPPGPKDVTLELLMASQLHMGHHTSLWNPANARYIYGIRQGIHIISLEETAAHLRRAARVVEGVAYRGGLILFAGTRPGHMQIVTQAATLARACHLFTRWIPGSITNSDVILAGLAMQMLDENDEPVEGMDRHLDDRRPLVPDLVVCLNPLENFVLLHECALANVPTIAVIDTNVEPSWATYAIPANDDSLRGVAVIASVLGRAGEAGQKRRLEDARKGKVTWHTPLDVQKFMQLQREYADLKAARTPGHRTLELDPKPEPEVDTSFENPGPN
ncbi:37S ribosomal protein MRP4 [Xylariaceae sp. FL0662B]|nr:37S ribosomal protein MRP4 [Xylariaceae sp. FL0662B]